MNRRKALRFAAALLGGAVVAWVVACVAAWMVVDEAFVERRLSSSLSRALGPHRVTVEEVSVRPFRFGVAFGSLEVVPVPEDSGVDRRRIDGPTRGSGSPSAASGPRLVLRVPEATLSGIRPWSLLGRPLGAAELTLTGARLASPAESAAAGSAARRGPAASSRPPPWFVPTGSGAGDRGGGGVRLGRVRITGATVDLGVLSGGPVARGVAHDLDLELRDVAVGTEGAPPLHRAVLAAIAELRTGLYRRRSSDGRSLFELEDVRVDLSSGRGRAARAYLRTFEPDPVPSSEGGGRTLDDTTEVRAGPVALEGLRVDTTGGGAPVSARSLLVDSLEVEIVESIFPRAPPAAGPPSRTPVEELRSVGVRMRIDTVTIRSGWIRYRERQFGHRAAGEILFADLEGTIHPLIIGDLPETERQPVYGRGRARVNGQAPLWLVLVVPPEPDGFTFDAAGGVAGLDLPSLNSILRPTSGVEIEGGRLDSLSFRMRVRSGRARGTTVPFYSDLSLELEDPSSGKAGLEEWAKGFLMDIRLNSDNLPEEGEDLRSGTCELVAPPGTTVWEFLWDCLAAGLKDVTGA